MSTTIKSTTEGASTETGALASRLSSPKWFAVRMGVQRGAMELRQSLTHRQDLIGQFIWAVAILVSLFFLRDNALAGTNVSVGTFMLPSMVGMSVGFNGMMTLAQSLTTEREDGTLLRAKAIPNGMVGYLVGKIVWVSGTVLLGMALILIPGVILLNGLAPTSFGAWSTLIWVTVLGLLATLPIGAVLGSLIDNPRSLGITMLPIMALVGISGIFAPITKLPEWLQTMGQIFPVYWLGLGARSAMLPSNAVSAEIGASWRHLETAGALGLWAVAGLLLAPVVLRRMARRESGSKVAERRVKAMQRIG
ncbi:ABC transporter permease [Streptomyces sp. NPDC057555]|uniref:ABC transporter permease n=1 Tax=Streptomyces sp. NPDC057555 TaxID=3346166 RepID=UPI0036B079DF